MSGGVPPPLVPTAKAPWSTAAAATTTVILSVIITKTATAAAAATAAMMTTTMMVTMKAPPASRCTAGRFSVIPRMRTRRAWMMKPSWKRVVVSVVVSVSVVVVSAVVAMASVPSSLPWTGRSRTKRF